LEASCWSGTVESLRPKSVESECEAEQDGEDIPVRSLKAAGLSWSIEASTSMGVRHFWQYSACSFLSLAMVLLGHVPHASGRLERSFDLEEGAAAAEESRVKCGPTPIVTCMGARTPVAWLPLDEGKARPCQPSLAFGSCSRSRLRRKHLLPPHLNTHPSIDRRSQHGHPLSPGLAGLLRSTLTTTMEPPAKRLRILQSVDVDETNPDYVTAKQKSQQRLKGTFESLFLKYENMHESQSDEIDMRENRIVVDRGHLRRLARQVNRNETSLLDSLGLGAGPDLPVEEEEKEEGGEDSEDELAPTQLAKASSAQKEKDQPRAAAIQSSPSNKGQSEVRNAEPVTTAMAQFVPSTPNPTTNLLQFVQFPQTPAGQQAQASFYTTLAQTINQAVQQAVAPLFSSILPNMANARPIPSTPMMNTDKITPATDPKWFFPPLPEQSPRPNIVRPSRETSPSTRPPQQGENAQPCPPLREQDQHLSEASEETSHQSPISATHIAASEDEEHAELEYARTIPRSSPRVEVQRKWQRRLVKYPFTDADDIHIAKSKTLHNHSWLEIKNSKEMWRHWPITIFHKRWSTHIKGRNLHLKDTSPLETIQVAKPEEREGKESENDSDALPLHHLPTPSSLGQGDDHTPVAGIVANTSEQLLSSSAHFDDDERDLLSLAGADLAEEQLTLENEEGDAFFPDADETILPSIELTDFVDEDTLQQDLLEGSPVEEIATTTLIKIKSEPPHSSPISKRKRDPAPIVYEAIPDSDIELENDDNIEISLPSQAKERTFICDICDATFKNLKNLRRHQTNPPSKHNVLRPRSASLDLIDGDELQITTPTTAHIKREHTTPPFTSLLLSTPLGPPRLNAGLSSSGAKSASGLSRKAYMKQVKQSWTKRPTNTPKTVTKRTSFRTIPQKRAWAEDTESEDELGF
jgi:hypothetical protein